MSIAHLLPANEIKPRLNKTYVTSIRLYRVKHFRAQEIDGVTTQL